MKKFITKNVLLIIALAISIILACVFIFFNVFASKDKLENLNEKPVVKIGVTLPLSGNLADMGNAIKDALLMAQRETPSGAKYKYELIIEDDGYDYKRTALNINNFVSKDVDVVFSLFDGAANVVAPIAEKNKINHIGCSWGEKFFREYHYSFNHFSKPQTQARAFVELLKEKDVKNVAIVAINYASMTEMIEYIEKDAKNNEIEIISKTFVNFGEKDFRIAIEKIKAENPDIIMLVMLNPELDIFIKQAFEMNLNKPYTAIDLLPDTKYKDILEGTQFVMSPSGNLEFKEKFAKVSSLQVRSCVANLYDSIKIIESLYEKYDEKPTTMQINKDLYNLRDFDSKIGEKVSVDESGIIDADLIKVKFNNGELVVEE